MAGVRVSAMPTHLCPRRDEISVSVFRLPEGDSWREDQTCTFCGSLNPDVLMARLEAGTVVLTPTDKGYKVYVRNAGGELFKQTYRSCPQNAACKGPDNCTHWVTRPMDETKFYFQHLSVEQRKRFVELLNARQLKLSVPGHFYVLPFFMSRVK